MQCGSAAGRPLLSVAPLKVQSSPRFRRPQPGLKATLTPAGGGRYFDLNLNFCPIYINPCSDPRASVMIKMLLAFKRGDHGGYIHMVI